ncbi:MAG: trypsin-like peptidase domain-containing protein, partial [Trichodesmium sp. St16_bin2-tuft]|nr:trypsin-like peptidase domain-containing protein [Trichodesmium sp. St16_bin2-tuft]
MSNLEDSIFLIRSAKKANVIGTGFIFHKQQNYSYLLTCAHVIEDVGGKENIRVNKLPAEVIKIGDVQGFDVAILKINTTFSASSLNLRILDGKEGKKLEVKIPGYYLFAQNHVHYSETIRGKMIVEVDGHKAIQIIENVTEKVAVGKLEIKKGILRSGYSGAPVIDINTESVVGLVTHKIDVDGKGKSGVAISIEALE